MASPHQHLIILWKWRHLEAPNADEYQALPVHGAAGKQVLHQMHQRGKANLLPLLQQLFTTDPVGECLLLLHQSAFDETDLKGLLSALSNPASLHAYFFGGGSDYLYYDLHRDAGLLEQHGDLAHRKYFGGVRSPAMLINHELDPLRFRQVWRHYFYQCKRNLYETRGQMLSHLTGCVSLQNQAGTAQNLLEETHSVLWGGLQQTLQTTFEQYASEEGSTISQSLESLQSFLKDQEVSELKHLHELNDRFMALLNNIHEPAY